MRAENQVIVRVPCSTSNLGSGFDALSAALNLYLTLDAAVEDDTGGLHWIFSGEVPSDNIIESAFRSALKHTELSPPGLRIKVHNPIPLRRGLGSSGAAIIGGIKLAEWLSNQEFQQQDILEIALPLEGHPDNLAASLLGGWVLSLVDDSGVKAERLSGALRVQFVVCVPEIEVPTSAARKILPPTYALQDVVFNLQRISLFVHALHNGKPELLREATRDRIHQPYRSKLVPGMENILALNDLPAGLADKLHCVTISGSGSTVLEITGG
jgi:homoserine kinase